MYDRRLKRPDKFQRQVFEAVRSVYAMLLEVIYKADALSLFGRHSEQPISQSTASTYLALG